MSHRVPSDAPENALTTTILYALPPNIVQDRGLWKSTALGPKGPSKK